MSSQTRNPDSVGFVSGNANSEGIQESVLRDAFNLKTDMEPEDFQAILKIMLTLKRWRNEVNQKNVPMGTLEPKKEVA